MSQPVVLSGESLKIGPVILWSMIPCSVSQPVVLSGESLKIDPVIFWSMIPCSLLHTKRFVRKPDASISSPLFSIDGG